MSSRIRVGQRILGAIDLAIDFATLGEYGLEPLPAQAPVRAGGPADGPCRERSGLTAGREAFAKVSRGVCDESAFEAGSRARRRAGHTV